MTWLAMAATLGLVLAGFPAVMMAWNSLAYRRAPVVREGERSGGRGVSLLIPARDEEASIVAAVESALASRGVELEVIVLDDHSTDRTAELVREIARREPRVSLRSAPPLPEGWCGKQHACWTLSKLARHDTLAWMDADVRLAPDGLARMAAFLDVSGASLVSGFPRQATGSWLEHLLLPLMHYVLLGYLPIWWMRRVKWPALGAGCGQLFMARRGDYERVGGHGAIRASLHDGVMLPRAFRRSGHRTDLCDATDLATCRMYRDAGEVWRGLSKNATEGMATPGGIGVWTALLLGGSVLPVATLVAAAAWQDATAMWLSAGANGMWLLTRGAMAWRFGQSWRGAALHPLGVVLLMAIQWQALARRRAGRGASWRGRRYPVKH